MGFGSVLRCVITPIASSVPSLYPVYSLLLSAHRGIVSHRVYGLFASFPKRAAKRIRATTTYPTMTSVSKGCN